jgi:ATP-dependent DNA ligase
MTLPLSKTYAPMEAQPAEDLPKGSEWHYEPKWDGFRCLAFRDGNRVDLESKSGKPLTRYFPELVEALRAFRAKQFVLDGEIVIPSDGNLSFERSAHANSSRGQPHSEVEQGEPLPVHRF